MATALETYLERDEVFLDQHADLEWVDDVHAYRCTRCTKVLVQHYIANCEHKFCANCRRLVDDGSRRWRCPLCNTFITDIGAQSAIFRERAVRLRLRCPNRKYGCPHVCPFKDIKEHLAGCEHTKERALPVLYKDGPTVEMLDRMFSAQLKNLRTEMEQRMDETEKRNARRDEWAWQLSLRANQMKRGMLRMERRQKDGEEKTAKLEDDIFQKKSTRGDLEGLSLSVEENKARIMELKGKSEYSIELIEFNNRKNNELIFQLKNEFQSELKTKEIQIQSEIGKLEQTMNEMRLEQKKEWAGTKEEVNGVIEEERKKREEVTSAVDNQILALTLQNESLSKDLQNQIANAEDKVIESEVRLNRTMAMTMEKNKSNLAQLESEINDRCKVIETNNKKNNELTRQQLKSELQMKVIEIKYEVEKYKKIALDGKTKWAETKEEVKGVIDTIEEEQKKRKEVTSAVNKNSSQILELNQRIKSLGKELQNQMIQVEEKIEESEVRLKQKLEEETSQITLSMESNQTNILKLGRETDDRFKEVEANNTKNNELTRQNLQKKFQTKVIEVKKDMEEKWAEVDGNISVTSGEISALKKKVNEAEEELIRIKRKLSPEQLIYNSIIRPEVQPLRRINDYYTEEPDFTWIASAERLLAGSKIYELLSEVFPLSGYPFSAQVKLTTHSLWSDIRFEVCFKDTNETNETKELPKPNILVTLKDQSKNKERKNIVKARNADYSNYKEKFEYNYFYRVGYIAKSLLQSASYNVENKIEIAIHVEAPEVAQSVYSEDGTLTWAIDDFRKRKQAEVDGLIRGHLSPYFYTGPKGLRVQVHAYLNGSDDYENKGLRIWVVFLDGVNDEDLDDYFKYKTTVTIVHPTQPTRRISKSKENIRWFEMGSCAEIESFLHNDTLYYKVTMEEIKRK